MDASELRALQAPLKAGYRAAPDTARVVSRAEGRIDPDGLACRVPAWPGETVAGLHKSAGGDGSQACSADMLLEALVACAGVTLTAVATAMGLDAAGRPHRRRGHVGCARHAGRRPLRADRAERDRGDVRARYRRRAGDCRETGRDDRALLRDPADAQDPAAHRLSRRGRSVGVSPPATPACPRVRHRGRWRARRRRRPSGSQPRRTKAASRGAGSPSGTRNRCRNRSACRRSSGVKIQWLRR